LDYLLNNMHFIVTHFPIALLISSFVFDLLAVLVKKKEWHSAGLLCLVVGTLGAIVSVVTGPDDPNPLVPTHELFGKLTMFLAILLSIVRLYFLFRKKKDIGRNAVYLFGALIGVLLVSYTGHLGGKMVHKDRPVMPPGVQQGTGGQPGRPTEENPAPSTKP
jgi:uncharacterized membrane protein